MNPFINPLSVRSLRNDVLVFSLDESSNVNATADAVFGRERCEFARACVERMDGLPESDSRVWMALFATHKALTMLDQAGYAYEPIPKSQQGYMNSPSEVGRRAVARAACVELARDCTYEVIKELVSKHPDDTRMKSYFWHMCNGAAPQVTAKASAKVRKIATEAGL